MMSYFDVAMHLVIPIAIISAVLFCVFCVVRDVGIRWMRENKPCDTRSWAYYFVKGLAYMISDKLYKLLCLIILVAMDFLGRQSVWIKRISPRPLRLAIVYTIGVIMDIVVSPVLTIRLPEQRVYQDVIGWTILGTLIFACLFGYKILTLA